MGSHKARLLLVLYKLPYFMLLFRLVALRFCLNSNAIFIKHTCVCYTYPSDTFCQHTFGLSPQPGCYPTAHSHSLLPAASSIDCRHRHRHRRSHWPQRSTWPCRRSTFWPNSNDRQINFEENIFRKIDLTCHASILDPRYTRYPRRSILVCPPTVTAVHRQRQL